MRISRTYLGVAAAAAALVASGPAFAHARLVHSNPAKNAVVASPKVITLTFDDELVPAFSSFTVTMPMGSQSMNVAVKTHVDKDGKTMTGIPSSKLAAGSYVVHWTATAKEDGHKMTGDVPFKVK
jgi:methionine-rich copper-binding protein CopC